MSLIEENQIEKSVPNLDTHIKSQKHVKAGQYIKSAVYGGLDGLITTLSIALSGIGSAVGANTIVALGLASLIADGLSMAIADYLATKSDQQYMKAEQNRQIQQMNNDFEAEKYEMIKIYEDMGLQKQVSKQIVEILSTNKEGFLSVMMIEELQLIPGEENPIKNSIVTFFSFAIFGLMPLIPFIIASVENLQLDSKLTYTSIIISLFFLFVLGFSKSFVTTVTWYYSSFETIIIGTISAAIAFGIGTAFGSV